MILYLSQDKALDILEQVGRQYVKDHEKDVDEASRYLPEEARGLVWQEATPHILTAAEYAKAVRSATKSDLASVSDHEAMLDLKESEDRLSKAVADGSRRFLGCGIVYGASLSAPGDDLVSSTVSEPLSCGGGIHRPPLPLVLPGPGKTRPGIGARLVVQVGMALGGLVVRVPLEACGAGRAGFRWPSGAGTLGGWWCRWGLRRPGLSSLSLHNAPIAFFHLSFHRILPPYPFLSHH